MATQAKGRDTLSEGRAKALEALAARRSQLAKIDGDVALGRLDPGPLKQYPEMAVWRVSDAVALEFWLTLVVVSFGPAASMVLSAREA